MDGTKVFTYLVQPGPPQRTIIVAFYERYRKEKGSVPIPQVDATLFAEYLVEHLEQFQTELKQYLASGEEITACFNDQTEPLELTPDILCPTCDKPIIEHSKDEIEVCAKKFEAQ